MEKTLETARGLQLKIDNITRWLDSLLTEIGRPGANQVVTVSCGVFGASGRPSLQLFATDTNHESIILELVHSLMAYRNILRDDLDELQLTAPASPLPADSPEPPAPSSET